MDEKRVVNTVFLLIPTLVIIIFNVSGNVSILQQGGNQVFGHYIQDATLRLYLFDALLYLPFLLLAAWSIRGIESHGRHIGEVLNE